MIETATIGQRLSKARYDAGVTLRELGAESGLSIAYLCDIEKGRRVPTVRVLGAYAEAFALDVDELATYAGRVPEDIREALRDPAFVAKVRALMEAA